MSVFTVMFRFFVLSIMFFGIQSQMALADSDRVKELQTRVERAQARVNGQECPKQGNYTEDHLIFMSFP